jgi:hypothetical protein
MKLHYVQPVNAHRAFCGVPATDGLPLVYADHAAWLAARDEGTACRHCDREVRKQEKRWGREP